jgi:hypothetical protein
MCKCIHCGITGEIGELLLPNPPLLNEWMCRECYEEYFFALDMFRDGFIKVEKE